MYKWFRNATFPLKTRLIAATCRHLQQLPKDHEVGRLDAALLAFAWGNIGYAAGFSYLRHVGQRAHESTGPVLECGSGATTLLVGAMTAQQGSPVIVLEHDRRWYDYMRPILAHLGYDHVRLVHAPLMDYGAYGWYQIPAVLPNGISLVVCDGPPGSIHGGRYGLMPLMGENLAEECVILLDDTHRAAEKEILSAWRKYRCMTTSHIGRFGMHAELVCC